MSEEAKKPVNERVILEICRDIEVCASELYYYYAEIYQDIPEISQLWKKTAQEEDNHAYQFELALKLCRKDIVQSVAVDIRTAQTILDKLKSLNATAKKIKPSIDDALNLAIRLEEKLSEYHLTSTVQFNDDAHKKLFDSMMKNDRGHVETLKCAYQTVLKSH